MFGKKKSRKNLAFFVFVSLSLALTSCSSLKKKKRGGGGRNHSLEEEYSSPFALVKQFEGKKTQGKIHGLHLPYQHFDIPMAYNSGVKKWVHYYLGRGKPILKSYLQRAGRYVPYIVDILEKEKMPKDLIFLAMVESGFKMSIKSHKSAVGPWQFVPFVGKAFGLNRSWSFDERCDPKKATMAAIEFLNYLYQRFENWELVFAAYNTGEGRMRRAIRRGRTRDFWTLRRRRLVSAETREYVPKIMALALISKNLEALGLEDIPYLPPLEYEKIKLPKGTDLILLSQKMNWNFKDLQEYNPELLRWHTPFELPSYTLKIPKEKMEDFYSCCSSDPSSLKSQKFQKYILQNRSSLHAVGKKHHVNVKILEEINNLKSTNILKRGQSVFLPLREGQGLSDPMYADIRESLERTKKRRFWKGRAQRLRLAQRRGRRVLNPRVFYTVKKGDTLWNVSRKLSVSLDTLIKTNDRLLSMRMIRAGDKLAIR